MAVHKRECHKCKFNGKGSNECLKCPGPAEVSYKGINFVWLDEQPDPEGFAELRIDRKPKDGYQMMEEGSANRLSSAEILGRMKRGSAQIRMCAELLEDALEYERNENAGRTNLGLELEDALVRIVATLMNMTPRELTVVWHKYHGHDDLTAAKDLGVSKQRIGRIIKQICMHNPEVASVIQAMRRIGVGGRRRGGGRSTTFRIEDFGSGEESDTTE